MEFSDILLLINVLGAVLCWKWGMEAFDRGSKAFGYFGIVSSAWNAAAVAYHFF
jgi:hypothetical protein